MKVTKVVTQLVRALVVAAGLVALYFSLTFSTDFGLHRSAADGSVSIDYIGAGAGLALASTIAATIFAVSLRCREISKTGGGWLLASVVGVILALVLAVGNWILAILLSSSTWGNMSGGDLLLREYFVESATPAWIWWTLLMTTVGVFSSIRLGVKTRSPRKLVDKFWFLPAIALLIILGNTLTTSLLSISAPW